MSPISIINAFPDTFSFYGLGAVKKLHDTGGIASSAEHMLRSLGDKDQAGVVFSFDGDRRGVILVLFDQAEDLSTYYELGNIIASKVATWMHEQTEVDVSISPPQSLRTPGMTALLENIVHSTTAEIGRCNYYHHRLNKQPVLVQTWVLPLQQKEVQDV